MPYNKKTAIENQKAFLRSQMKCGLPAIEKRAKETLKAIEDREKAQKEMDRKVKAFNQQWEKQRKKIK